MTNLCPNAYCYGASLSPTPLDVLVKAVKWLGRAYDVHSQRLQLSKLSDEALNDIGLTRKDAQREADRPFWDMP